MNSYLQTLIQMLSGGGGDGSVGGMSDAPPRTPAAAPSGPLPPGPTPAPYPKPPGYFQLPDGQWLNLGVDSVSPAGFVRPGGQQHFVSANPQHLHVKKGGIEALTPEGEGGVPVTEKKRRKKSAKATLADQMEE